MKKSLDVLLAGSVGIATVLGVIALRKILKDKTYQAEYTDTHNIFIKNNKKGFSNHGDGIEIHAMM